MDFVEEPKFAARRRMMVAQLKANKLAFSADVLDAISKVPRHLFCQPMYVASAYEDVTLPIAAKQTISQPSTVARQMSLLELKPGEKVLEIGTGSGYQTACLVAFGVDVYSIERQRALYDITSALFRKLDIRVNNICGDGYLGMPEHAPFDKIIVTAGAFQLPPKLMAQLKVGGMMIIPVEDASGVSNMHRVRRIDESQFAVDKLEECNFVPMLSGVNNA
ncbi:MAG: protein-L-isoaspartate(D-aspartate) O-methyltransferase [Bacteroidales bacterium]|jgi:protein-L-isoaspartate(D-aspartate) O-methyltransferase|nr:protein-L-isoaspartate(D-aspartate) O-methyltransferase [Bacteroidales bacterium]